LQVQRLIKIGFVPIRSGLVGTCLVSLLFVAGFTNCQGRRPSQTGIPKPAESANAGVWFDFSSYPGAQLLCREETMAFSGTGKTVAVNWRSYITPDAAEKVSAFYSEHEGNKGQADGPSITFSRGDNQKTLSIFPASATGYPSCQRKPPKDSLSVIVVSMKSGY
jgi:hypothetical protein